MKGFMKNLYPLSNQSLATCYVILSGILYGLWGYFGTMILNTGLSIYGMLFWRFLIAALSMLLICIYMRPAFPKNKMVLVRIFTSGAVLYGGCSATFFMASKLVGTGLAMVIFFSYPGFVMLFARVFDGHKLSRISIICLFTLLIGLTMLKGSSEEQFNGWGIFWALASALCYAGYVYQGKKNVHGADPLLSTLVLCSGATVLFAILGFYDGTLIMPPSFDSWYLSVINALLCTSWPIILLLSGLKYIAATKASILSVFEPLVGVIVGVVFLDETVDLLQMLGVAVILSAAILIQME